MVISLSAVALLDLLIAVGLSALLASVVAVMVVVLAVALVAGRALDLASAARAQIDRAATFAQADAELSRVRDLLDAREGLQGALQSPEDDDRGISAPDGPAANDPRYGHGSSPKRPCGMCARIRRALGLPAQAG